MELIYSEMYGVDKDNIGYYVPSLEFSYYYDEMGQIPKSIYAITENEESLYTTYIPFFDTFFDGLTDNTIGKLQSMLDFANKYNQKNYIDKSTWKSIIFTTNIKCNQIQKVVNTHLEKKIDKNNKHKLYRKHYSKREDQQIVENYYNNTDMPYDKNISSLQTKIYNSLTPSFNNIYKPSFKQQYTLKMPNEIISLSLMRYGLYGGIMNIDYKFQFNNELDLLYTFLDCIFSSDYDYKVKQCKSCPNFFITLNNKNNNCPDCSKQIKKLQKMNYENKDIVKLERKVNQLFYAPNRLNEKENYYNQKRQLKLDLKDNKITEEDFKNWLLSQYRTK